MSRENTALTGWRRARIAGAVCSGLLVLALLGGCGKPTPSSTSAGETNTDAASPVTFVDVTRQAGIDFKQNTGGFGLKWLPEQLGSGAACFDFDSDGWPDIYFPNGRDWTTAELDAYKSGTGKPHLSFINKTLSRRPKPRRTLGALYRNNHNGLLAQGEDIVPIPGTKRREQLEENLGALDVELSVAELERINELAPLGIAAGTRYPEALMGMVNR